MLLSAVGVRFGTSLAWVWALSCVEMRCILTQLTVLCLGRLLENRSLFYVHHLLRSAQMDYDQVAFFNVYSLRVMEECLLSSSRLPAPNKTYLTAIMNWNIEVAGAQSVDVVGKPSPGRIKIRVKA